MYFCRPLSTLGAAWGCTSSPPLWGEASPRSFCLPSPSFGLLWVQISDLFCSCAQQNVGIVNSGGVSLQDIREGIFYS